MGSFIPNIFSGGSSAGKAVVRQSVSDSREKKKVKKSGRKNLLLLQQQESDIIQKNAQNKEKLTRRVGANSQISTTSRGVLGQPNTGRRLLSI